MKTNESLSIALTGVRRRLLSVGLSIGFGWALIGAILFLIAWMWLDLALELTPGLRVAADVGAALLAVVVVLVTMGWNLRMGGSLALARRLDQTAGTRGQILTGVDLMQGSGFRVRSSGGAAIEAVGAGATMGQGLAALAVERATELATRVSHSLAVPVRPMLWPAGSLAVLLGGIAVLGIASPRLAGTQWKRFVDPYGDHPPYSRIWFEIQPGNVKVVYGDGLDVRAKASGPLEKVDLVLLPADGSTPEVLPMFPEPDDRWRATVANVTTPQKYLVRSGRARSRRYDIDIITVPRFEQVTFRIVPPAYTRQSAYEGPLPQGGVAGLPWTRVEVRVRSNRPLSGGVIEGSGFTGEEARGAGVARANSASVGARLSHPLVASRPAAVELGPGSKPHEAVATFVITGKGAASIHLTDVESQRSKEAFVFPIALLADERPFIRIMEPQQESLATPDAVLPVVLSAEDDYGISRVRLYRSLNDSRPLPADVPTPRPAPARWGGTSSLPLGDCGVEPGDVIKLFARVEDNDPDGAKGSESAVVTVRIISQEDYERLMRTREGLEVMQAKYEQANRRIEALLEEIQKLQKEIENEPPESPLSDEQRKKLEELADQFAKAAEDIAKAARHKLPYDLDQKLTPELEKLAREMREAAEETEQLSKARGMSVSGLDRKLRELAGKCGGNRREFQEETTEPLEHLAAIYPLLEDQAVYIALYQRQRDLAERLASLKGRDSGDDPQLKARMRDLELEQRQIREALEELLDAIEEHVTRLPEDERLDDLRETAQQFVKNVRESGATDVQGSAETGLAEFSGTRAAEKSKEAADIMEKFIGRCQGMGGQAAGCLKFAPKLSAGLGNTIEQLLGDAGLSMGNQGIGTGGGYSAQRSSLQNVGLYGNLPTLGATAESGRTGGNARLSRPGGSGGTRHEAEPLSTDPEAAAQAVGAAGAQIPVQYRRKVGQYFERVADEIGEDSGERLKRREGERESGK